MSDEVRIRLLRPGDTGWIAERLTVHAEEEGFDGSFGTLIAGILAEIEAHHDPAREAGWIAERDGRRLGCVFCVAEDDTTARLRLMFLEPEARGLGLGRRLLEHCLAFARTRGYRRMVLLTQDTARAACALYRSAGFTVERERQVTVFGQPATEQHYGITL